MSVRLASGATLFLADAPDYTGAYTMAGWVRKDGDATAAWVIASSVGYEAFEEARQGNNEILTLDTEFESFNNEESVTFGAWVRFALVRESATSLKVYFDNDLTYTATADASGRVAATLTKLYNNSDAGNTDLVYWRVWEAALSEADLALESASATPVRTDDLWADWPLIVHTDLNDQSGNNRHLTGTGELTTQEMVISDDFNRSDGDVGENWLNDSGADVRLLISGNQATYDFNGTSGVGYGVFILPLATDDVSASCVITAVDAGANVRFRVRGNDEWEEDGVIVDFISGDGWYLPGANWNDSGAADIGVPYEMRLEVIGTTANLYVDDVLRVTDTVDAPSGNRYLSMYMQSGEVYVDDFYAEDIAEGGGEEEPVLVPVYDPSSIMTPLVDENNCVQGWAVRLVSPPVGLTPIYDPSSIMVALVDENNCVQSWAIRIVAAS